MESPLIGGDEEIASAFQKAGTIEEFSPGGKELIKQGNYDSHLFILLCGRVEIRVNGRAVAIRGPKQHVGEMALIEPCGPRSASVISLEPTIALRISEDVVIATANARPALWRRFAAEVVQRLRQRAGFHNPPNEQPFLFIASSVEGLPVANAIQLGLSHSNFITTVWSNNAFTPSRTTVEDLLQKAGQYDIALVILTPDDLTESRQTIKDAPRDNCVFELGLFLGVLGRERTFFAKPRGIEVKIPTDLWGLNPIEYDSNGDAATLDSRTAPVVTVLSNHITRLGVR
ncbi:nucleotide-binding protein [bacterium]|nr:nucleotide-binding protein [bacterium]